MKIAQEEIFGPVVVVEKFHSEEEVIKAEWILRKKRFLKSLGVCIVGRNRKLLL